MIRRPPRSTLLTHSFPTRRSSDLLFGDETACRKQFMNSGTGLDELRERLASFAKRTLRRDVLEYIKYTERKALTQPFNPTDDEQALYERISAFLQKEDSYALPKQIGRTHL